MTGREAIRQIAYSATRTYTVWYSPKPSKLTDWKVENRIFSGTGAECHGFIMPDDTVDRIEEW